ncbi:LysM peptidoglycan-binding domain-containing protein [Solidesulfovibrio carbinoliphilus]|nr:LysM domain-containing protein [Solidesulfovibrio carbinoliphilus]
MSWRMLFVLPWVLAASPAARAAQTADIPHVARPGDTPAALARAYRVTLAALLARNPGLDPCRIRVGDVLLVPAGPAPSPGPAGPEAAASPSRGAVLPDEEAPGLRYVVVPGDSPAAIAERFGIPLGLLSRANPGLDPKTLAVGRVLAIPGPPACPPPVAVSRPGDPPAGAPLVLEFQ